MNSTAKPLSGWIRALLGILFLSVTGTAVYYLWTEFPELNNERSTASNLGFFLLINLNIIVVMILVFLVAKNIITLALDRKRKILGSRLRARLIAAFVGLSLIPTVLLFLVAKGILESVLQGWFSPQVAASVDGAINIAKYHSSAAQTQLHHQSRQLATRISELSPYLQLAENQPSEDISQNLVSEYLKEKREEYGLFSIAVVNEQGREIGISFSKEAAKQKTSMPGFNLRAIQQALQGAIIVRPEQSFDGEFLRGYARIRSNFAVPKTIALPNVSAKEQAEESHFVVILTYWVPPELGNELISVMNSYDDYKELRTYRRPLASSYLLTLVVVTLLIVFAATWVGFYLARGLAVPIGLLAKATEEVAHGNLDCQIPEVGDDELSILVRSFNTMTSDLKHTTGELVARRRYMETVFENVAVGVISLDADQRIQAINIAALDMLGVSDSADILSKRFDVSLPSELTQQVKQMLEELFASEHQSVPNTLVANISISFHEQLKHVQVTATKLLSDFGETLGVVLLLDNLTDLVSAQRMAAWREVARRIAHEIKNPLTPIQLCAERMQRRFLAEKISPTEEENSQRNLVLESTGMIVQQVENLRTLVNEFSRFARMPRSIPRPENLHRLIQECLGLFRESNPDIHFHEELDERVPELEIDREQMTRVLVNLIDNAIASVHTKLSERKPLDNEVGGQIGVTTHYDSDLGLVSLVINDNGTGIPDSDKSKLFEPYFSTKKGGTGLGLAIVSTIISDHNGFIRVRDNKPSGASFVIELPVAQRPLTRSTRNTRSTEDPSGR